MIFFIGSPLIDIIAHVNKNFLEKYRLKPDDTIRATPELELVFKDVMKFHPIVQLGGSVVNSARLFQWVSKKSYPVVITGCIGSDDYGKFIRQKLGEEEIQSELFEISDVSTGMVAVLLTDQYRSMVTHLGASNCFRMKHLTEELWAHLRKTDYFYFSGFSLGTCYDVIEKICDYFIEKKKTIVMNLGASFLSTKFPKELKHLFSVSDVIFGNEEFEGRFFEQREGTAMGNPLSPFLANLFMSRFEMKTMKELQHFPRVWLSCKMILFFGTTFVDIIANVNKEFLDKYHLKLDEAIRATPEIESIFEELTQFNPEYQLGGSIIISARLFQWVSRKSYPLFMSAIIVGLDEYGKLIKKKVEEEDIPCDFLESREVSTGVTAVLVVDETRTIVSHNGPSKEVLNEHLEKTLWKHLKEADYFYFSAFSTRTCFDIIVRAGQYFRNNHKTIIMNLGASILCEKYPQELKSLFEYSDLVFGNEKEFRAFFQISNTEDVPDLEILKKLNDIYNGKSSRVLVMTRAQNPVYIFQNGELKTFDVPSIPKEKIVDTNGAGDAFVAGFLAQYCQKRGIDECVKCGLWTSREIIQQQGCNFDINKVYEM